jgi:hypothetical protein
VADIQTDAVPAVRRRRWRRFSLRTLLVVMTATCVWIGVVTNRANRQQRAVEAFTRRGASINYSYQEHPSPVPSSTFNIDYDYRTQTPGPEWLRRLIGDKYFVTPVSLRIFQPAIVTDGAMPLIGDLPHLERLRVTDLTLSSSELVHLRQLPRLKLLTFSGNSISPTEASPDFEFLSRMSQLEVFSIDAPQFGDDQMKSLANCSQLRQAFLQETTVGDAGLAQLAHMRNLQMLNLMRTKVTDAGMKHLARLPKLTYLCLLETDVTDVGLADLAGMAGLTNLELHGSQVTRDGVRRLRQALPNCEITY